MKTATKEVLKAITLEREYQKKKWGPNKPQSLAGYMLIVRKELEEAENGWNAGKMDGDSPLSELVQVAATCLAALEEYGVSGNVICQLDKPDPKNAVTAKEYMARRSQKAHE